MFITSLMYMLYLGWYLISLDIYNSLDPEATKSGTRPICLSGFKLYTLYFILSQFILYITLTVAHEATFLVPVETFWGGNLFQKPPPCHKRDLCFILREVLCFCFRRCSLSALVGRERGLSTKWRLRWQLENRKSLICILLTQSGVAHFDYQSIKV